MFLFSDASVRLYCHFLHIRLRLIYTKKIYKKNYKEKFLDMWTPLGLGLHPDGADRAADCQQ